jgi:hypothetical protein
VVATLAPAAAAAAQSTRCSFRGCRELREGGGRGSRAGALSGQQPNCPAAGAKEDCGGSAVAARVPGDAAPPAQGLWARKPRCLWAAPVRIIFRASISLRPRRRHLRELPRRRPCRGLGLGPGRCCRPGRGSWYWIPRLPRGGLRAEVTPARGVAPARRAGGWVAVLPDWGPGYPFRRGLRPPRLSPNT